MRESIQLRKNMLNPEKPPYVDTKIVEEGLKNRFRLPNCKSEQYQPLIFEDCYIKSQGQSRLISGFDLERDNELKMKADPSNGNSKYKGFHMFVLCHGFHGNSFDVRNFKNILSIMLPHALCLSSEANEENSDLDLETMGKKLADEVLAYIKENCPGS